MKWWCLIHVQYFLHFSLKNFNVVRTPKNKISINVDSSMNHSFRKFSSLLERMIGMRSYREISNENGKKIQIGEHE
jgi:hypothetical protein